MWSSASPGRYLLPNFDPGGYQLSSSLAFERGSSNPTQIPRPMSRRSPRIVSRSPSTFV